MSLRHPLLFAVASLACLGPAAAQAEPIPIAEIKHEGDVDFEKEILPIFRRNCLACHSATEAQSDLVLESPQAILKGGSTGPAVVAGKSGESLLLALAALQKEPHMPPPDNDVKAKNLTSEELGLLKLWIDQGAKGDVSSASQAITWQPLPPGINPIYAVAVTPDGQYAAASRANQIFLYHVPSRRELGRLTDPSLIERGVYKQPGVADLDLVQSLAFSPSGQWLASGGFRTVKLWKQPTAGKRLDLAGLEGPALATATAPDGKLAAVGEESGKIKLIDLASGQTVATLEGHTAPAAGVAFTADSARLISGSHDKTFRVWNVADRALVASVETPAAVNGVAIVGDGTQVATAHGDNQLRIWAIPTAAPAEGAEPAKPVKEIGNHGGPILAVVSFPGAPNKVLTGCQDGNVRLVDITSGNVERQSGHGAPVTSVAASADGKRIVSAGSANVAKLWNAENGSEIVQMKGNVRAGLVAAEATRGANLAKKHVELTKKDLEEATKRKTAEEENEKKSKEALTKAQEEFKPKEEAAKKATEEKEAADKALAEATTGKTKADGDKKTKETALAQADEALKKAAADKDAAVKAAADATTAAKVAADALTAAQAALAGDAENQGLKDAVAAAEKESQDKSAAQKTADEAKLATEKAFVDAETARKTAETEKQAADKAATDAQNALTQADQKVKQIAPNYQKAIDERTAAERTMQTAQRSVERAAESVKKATEAIPGFEAIVKEREAAAQQRDEAAKSAATSAADSEKPFAAAALSPDGSVIALVGEDQSVHTYDGQTGAPLDVLPASGAPLKQVAFFADRALVALSAGGAGQVWDLGSTDWQLARTIGSPDMATELVDRVTALDFSPDGKLLAVGGGEPSRSGEVRIYDIETGSLVRAIEEPHSDTVNAVRFSPDGQQLASCAADRFVKIWNGADGKFVRSFEGHTHHVLGISWRADGRMLVSCGADMVVKVWDTLTGDQLRTIQNQFNKEVTSVQFVGDGDIFVATAGDARVRFMNAGNGGNVRDFGGTADYMYAGAVSADGKTVLAGGLDSILRIWNDQGQEQAQFTPPAVLLETAAK
jgi:WD40 repeat protein